MKRVILTGAILGSCSNPNPYRIEPDVTEQKPEILGPANPPNAPGTTSRDFRTVFNENTVGRLVRFDSPVGLEHLCVAECVEMQEDLSIVLRGARCVYLYTGGAKNEIRWFSASEWVQDPLSILHVHLIYRKTGLNKFVFPEATDKTTSEFFRLNPMDGTYSRIEIPQSDK